MTTQLNTLDKILSRSEKLINHFLYLDPETQIKLNAIDGKQILIVVEHTDVRLKITIENATINLNQTNEQKADVVIKGKPFSLFSLLIKKQNGEPVFPSDIEIKGDINLAQKFQKILKDLDIDWEEILSQYLGDGIARKLSLFIKSGRSYVKKSINSFESNVSDYLRFEKNLLPDQLLIDEFNQSVDHLRDEVERLKARIEKLESVKTT